MQVEISPWSHVETSFLVSPQQQQQQQPEPEPNIVNKERKSQSTVVVDTTGTTGEAYNIAACFIESATATSSSGSGLYGRSYQSSKKRRKVTQSSSSITTTTTATEDRIPVFTMTSQSHTVIMVEQPPSSKEQVLPPPQIQESSILQFYHRPNTTTKMISSSSSLSSTTPNNHRKSNGATTSNTTKETNDATNIDTNHYQTPPLLVPAVYDINQHRMYTVQQQQQLLPSQNINNHTNRTKIICHYYPTTNSNTNNIDVSTQQSSSSSSQFTCEVTFPPNTFIHCLSILYLSPPTTSSSIPSPHRANSNNKNCKKSKRQSTTGSSPTTTSSILYGSTTDNQLFIVMTQPITQLQLPGTTADVVVVVGTKVQKLQQQHQQQLVLQYLDTPYTTSTTGNNSYSQRSSSNRKNNANDTTDQCGSKKSTTIALPAGVVAEVMCCSRNNHTVTTNSGDKNSFITSSSTTTSTREDNRKGTTTVGIMNNDNHSYIVRLYQILYSTGTVQLIRQHVRLIQEPDHSNNAQRQQLLDDNVVVAPSQKIIYCSTFTSIEQQLYTNTITPIHFHPDNFARTFIDKVKILGLTTTTATATGSNDDVGTRPATTTIVMSYRSSLRQHGTSSRNYENFYATILTTSSDSIPSSLSFPFVVSRIDDNDILHQHACLVGPSIIGVLGQRSKQIYLYDLHRGGLIHIVQPFLSSSLSNDVNHNTIINNSNAIPVTETICLSLLADMKQSKVAVVYISPNTTKNYCIAYASIGLVNRNNSNFSGRNVPYLSLADGLVAASSSSLVSAANHLHQSIDRNCTRRLFPDANRLIDSYQNEMVVLQQTAIQKAIQLLNDIIQQINDSTTESSQPSFVLKSFDFAMQTVYIYHESHRQKSSKRFSVDNYESGNQASSRLRNGSIEDSLRDSSPLKDIKMNGGKVLNGFHKKSDIVSPITAKEQSCNFNGNSHPLLPMDASLKPRPKHNQYQISDLPQVLIDAAAHTMTYILSIHIPDTSAVHSIRNDARVLLRRLIRSGKVSARSPLNLVPKVGSSYIGSATNFMQCLRSLELSRAEHKNGEVWSAYTPFDMICDMFDNCADVSERQMVIALRYTLFNTRPNDVASYFVRNKNACETDNLRNQGSNLLSIMKQDHMDSIILQHKMVAAGAAYVIHRIMKYSIGFNVALLRNAIESEFDSKEFHVLLRLQFEMLSHPDKFHLSTASSLPMKNLLQLTVTLCDSLPTFRDRDSGIEDTALEAGKLPRVEHLLSMLSSATGQLLSVQKLVQETIDKIIRKNEIVAQQKQRQQRIEVNQQANVIDRPKITPATALPPYQIERLLF